MTGGLFRTARLGRLEVAGPLVARFGSALSIGGAGETLVLESEESSPGLFGLDVDATRRRLLDLASLRGQVLPCAFDDFGHLAGWYQVDSFNSEGFEWPSNPPVSRIRWQATLTRVGGFSEVLASTRLTTALRRDPAEVAQLGAVEWFATGGGAAMLDDATGVDIIATPLPTDAGPVQYWMGAVGSFGGWAAYNVADVADHYAGSPRLFDGAGVECVGHAAELDMATPWSIDNGIIRWTVNPAHTTPGAFLRRWRWHDGVGWLTDGDAWRFGPVVDSAVAWVDAADVYQAAVLRRTVDELTVRLLWRAPDPEPNNGDAVAGYTDVTMRRGLDWGTLTIHNRKQAETHVAIADAHDSGTLDATDQRYVVIADSDSPTVGDRWAIVTDHNPTVRVAGDGIRWLAADMDRPRVVGLGASKIPHARFGPEASCKHWRGQPALTPRITRAVPHPAPPAAPL